MGPVSVLDITRLATTLEFVTSSLPFFKPLFDAGSNLVPHAHGNLEFVLIVTRCG